MGIIRTAVGVLLLSTALSATAFADNDRELLGVLLEQDRRPRSTLANDINRQLRTARGIEHELSLEQSRVNARSASALQRRQTTRDIALTGQNLNTLKTAAPQQRSIPLLERRLDRVSRPTGDISRDPGLESGFSTSLGLGSGAGTSLGLSGSIGGR